MQHKAAIFDLDGTLVDSLVDIAASANHVLSHYNLPAIEVDKFRYLAGQGADALLGDSLGDKQAGHLEEAVALWHKYYGQHKYDNTKPFDGIDSMLTSLAKRGLKLAILSNKPDGPTKEVVAHLLGKHNFATVRGKVEQFPPKPDPASAKKLVKDLGLAPEQCLYVGDTKADMLTGKRTGLFTVGVTWGFRSREELVANGADVLINQPEELLKYVDATFLNQPPANKH